MQRRHGATRPRRPKGCPSPARPLSLSPPLRSASSAKSDLALLPQSLVLPSALWAPYPHCCLLVRCSTRQHASHCFRELAALHTYSLVTPAGAPLSYVRSLRRVREQRRVSVAHEGYVESARAALRKPAAGLRITPPTSQSSSPRPRSDTNRRTRTVVILQAVAAQNWRRTLGST